MSTPDPVFETVDQFLARGGQIQKVPRVPEGIYAAICAPGWYKSEKDRKRKAYLDHYEGFSDD